MKNETFYSYDANNVFLADSKSFDIQDRLRPQVYQVMAGPAGFYLQESSIFRDTAKIYGNGTQIVQRILTSWTKRQRNTGVLLAGEKGSGKTLTARLLAQNLLLQGIPVLVVNQSYNGPGFTQFLSRITQPTMVLFDEFEKIYRDLSDQEGLLTLLDGMTDSNKLFIFTVNSTTNLADPLVNRPGRILYRIDYSGVSDEAVIEYCQDNLLNQSYAQSVLSVCNRIPNFNFDMLQSLVEEVNTHNESATTAVRWLNIRMPKLTYEDFNFTVENISDKSGRRYIVIRHLGGDPVSNPLDNWSLEMWEVPDNFEKYLLKDDGSKMTWLLDMTTGLPTRGGVDHICEKIEAENEKRQEEGLELIPVPEFIDLYFGQPELISHDEETQISVYNKRYNEDFFRITTTYVKKKVQKSIYGSVHSWDVF